MFSTHSLKNCPIVDPFAREPPESSLEWRSSAVGVQRRGRGWSWLVDSVRSLADEALSEPCLWSMGSF